MQTTSDKYQPADALVQIGGFDNQENMRDLLLALWGLWDILDLTLLIFKHSFKLIGFVSEKDLYFLKFCSPLFFFGFFFYL